MLREQRGETRQACGRERARLDFEAVVPIATAQAFEKWSINTGAGLTFPTFVNSFGYQESDGKQMYDAVQRIQQAALPP